MQEILLPQKSICGNFPVLQDEITESIKKVLKTVLLWFW